MTDATPSSARGVALRVLAVGPSVLDELLEACLHEGDDLVRARSSDDALTAAAEGAFDLAFVDLATDDFAGLSLVHHLGVASPGLSVHAVVDRRHLALGAQALSLGAERIVVAPSTADEVARALVHARRLSGLEGEVLALREALARRPAPAPEEGRFAAEAARLLRLSARHGRRLSVVVFEGAPEASAETPDGSGLRASDLVARVPAGEEPPALVHVLPETDGLGASAVRRRLLGRWRGERRGAGAAAADADRTLAGVATFPHDGATLDALVAVARTRARSSSRSVVAERRLGALDLPGVVDALLERPLFDAGAASTLPLDLARGTLVAIGERAVREAGRAGAVLATATLVPGASLATAARKGLGARHGTVRVFSVKEQAGCDNVEALVVEAESSTWVCCGRVVGERFRGVHAACPDLGALVSQLVARAGRVHAG